MTMPSLHGLSESEATARRARGLGNTMQPRSGRTYFQIVRDNAFTFINIVLFAVVATLAAMGKFGDAFVTGSLVGGSVIVAIVQEAITKRKLDHIALLVRPVATVMRDGAEKAVNSSEIVLGDVLVARPGDQIMVDGEVLAATRVQVDESLLTGESELVPKHIGDTVYSGSFCMSGTVHYEARKVGAESFASRLTVEARHVTKTQTPMQRELASIIRTLVIVIVPLSVLVTVSLVLREEPPAEQVRVAAVIVALVPQGLLVMATAAYTMGAIRVSSRGALIQQIDSVESTSHVDILCLDKTGTLTTNRIRLEAVHPAPGANESGPDHLDRILGDFAASTPEPNRTTEAIVKALGGRVRPPAEQAPFSSDRKWSGLAWDERSRRWVYVMGAPEALRPSIRDGAWAFARAEELAPQGTRVLLFAEASPDAVLSDSEGTPILPPELTPLAVLAFSDEIRSDAKQTLDHFEDLGIKVKVISGDNPQTVASLCNRVGLSNSDQIVSGLDLNEHDETQMNQAASRATVFGRISPTQKQKLVQALQQQGGYVAMIGDGVNDVLALKQANVGIAMQSGSQATRGVANIVLVNDSFAALPAAFREGQRIIRGMGDVVRLLITRTSYLILAIGLTQLVGLAFPVTPKHSAIASILTIGIPILVLAAWAQPGKPGPGLLRDSINFVLPASVTISAVALGVYIFYLTQMDDPEVARTAFTTVTILCGVVLIFFVEPPNEWWVGGDVLSGDWRPALLAVGMLVTYVLVMAVSPLREFFELSLLGWGDYLAIAGLVTIWMVVQRWIWRRYLPQPRPPQMK